MPQRPALAIKIDNYPAARPQSGLGQADIVFEEPVEGGITRLVAVFQCQNADLVGPIRSARAVDAPILDQLSKPIFIHVGGIPPVLSLVKAADLFDEPLLARGPVVQNPRGRYAPYDTYVSAAAGWQLQPTDTAPPAPIFTYSSTTPEGTPVTSLHIPYSQSSNVTWTWYPGSGNWLLSYSGVPATIAEGGQIAVPNVVVQTVQVTYGPWVENSEGALEVQCQLTGSGPLEVFRNGLEMTGTWRRSSLEAPTRLVASNGSTIALQSPSSEVAGRRSAPVSTMGVCAGGCWAQAALAARSAPATATMVVLADSISVRRANRRTIRCFISDPFRFSIRLQPSPYFIAGRLLLQTVSQSYRLPGKPVHPACAAKYRRNRHRGCGHPLSPATPLDKRVRIGRFDELIPCQLPLRPEIQRTHRKWWFYRSSLLSKID